jgi:hypothetical protein
VNQTNQRITGLACVVAAALAVLAAGLGLTREQPRVRTELLLAQNSAPGEVPAARAPETDADGDECTATAGFLGPAEDVEAEGSTRRRVCKRYA